MDININVYQKTIEFIVNEMGHTVLQVFPFNDENAYYFLAHKFEPSCKLPSEDIQYNQVIGINITDIVRTMAAADNRSLQARLEEYILKAKVIRMEFPNNVRWFKFAASYK